MKRFAAVSILAGLGFACWFGWRQVGTSGAGASGAAKAGSEMHPAGGKEAAPDEAKDRSRTGRSRETQTAEVKAFAARFAAFFAVEMAQDTGDPGRAEKRLAISEELRSLDPAQLKALVAELALVPDLDARLRELLVAFTMESLAEKSPIQALELLTERATNSQGGNLDQKLLSRSLAAMARSDPGAAAKWVGDHQEKFPGLITPEVKRGVLMGAMDKDPAMVFQLSARLGLGSDAATGAEIARGARTPEQRAGVLTALREHLASLPEESRLGLQEATLTGLGAGAAVEGYGQATDWLAGAALTPEESGLLARNLELPPGSKDTGKWIDWMAVNAPGEQLGGKVGAMVESWTRSDYKAAGEWLNATPAGSVREAAVASYARTLAGYEPEAAAQWSLSLPAGPERDDLLETVRAGWQKKDPVAAAKFAQDHGINR